MNCKHCGKETLNERTFCQECRGIIADKIKSSFMEGYKEADEELRAQYHHVHPLALEEIMNSDEKKFIRDALRGGSTMTFIAEYILLCRKLSTTPDYKELEAVRKQVNEYFMEPK